MSSYFKGGNLVVAPISFDTKAKITVKDTDLMFECIDRNTDLPKSISLTDLLDRIDLLEKAWAEFILIGEKKDG